MQGMNVDIDQELAEFEAEEKARLGLDRTKEQWSDTMVNPMFTKSQRSTTTILVSGLTMSHDYFVEAVLQGLGYRVRMLDCPDNDALRFGKEFGNRAQCNPTYFTVGNLVKELCRLRDEEGQSAQHIVDNYLFLTAGACGPCRFGMYVTEYRKALRDAGFDGFRVLLFQQTGGFEQATGEEVGLELNPRFFIGLAKALLAGDVLNALAYRIRPYEIEEGATDLAMAESKRVIYESLASQKSVLAALRKARSLMGAVPVDRSRVRPKVSIIGEFWAMTTEGDGNYQLQSFLEGEGAECDIQLVTAWILYMLWEGKHDALERARLKDEDGGQYGLKGSDVGVTMATLWLGEVLTRVVFHTFAWAIGLRDYHLPNMDEIARIGHSLYNNELRGGEGHMEVSKLIMNVVNQKSHMTVSVKPFGCMPSSGVSDGVQSIVTELHPEAIFCAVETSGDGAVNFYSRVQMFLFKARQRAQQEFDKALEQYGLTLASVEAFLKDNPRYDGALYRAPHQAAGTAADVLHEIAPLVGKNGWQQLGVHGKRLAMRIRHRFTHELPREARYFAQMTPYLPALLRKAATEARHLGPQVKATFNGLLEKALLETEESRRMNADPPSTSSPDLVQLGDKARRGAAAPARVSELPA